MSIKPTLIDNYSVAINDKYQQYKCIVNFSRSSIDGATRRGRRWRDKSPEKSQESPDLQSGDVSRTFQGSPAEPDLTDDKDTSRPFIEDLKIQQTSRSQGEIKQTDDVQQQKRQQTTRLQAERNQKEAMQPLKRQADTSAKPAVSHIPEQINTPATPSQLQKLPSGGTPQLHKDLTTQKFSSAIVPQSHVYHSTPLSTQSNQTFEHKAQLEGEIQSLMRKLYDMDSNAQKQELDSTAYLAQLEAKVSVFQVFVGLVSVFFLSIIKRFLLI